MKRILIVLLALVLALCCCACAEDGSSVFEKTYKMPKGTSLMGMDLSGLDREEAFAQLEAAVESYTLQLTVDGEAMELSGKDFGLTCSRKDFDAAVDAMEAGTQPDFSKLIRYNDAKLRPILKRELNWSAVDAAIVYDEAAGAFKLENEVYGLETDHNALADDIREAIRTLAPQYTATGFSRVVDPDQTADNSAAAKAVDFANKMGSVQLTYNFGTEERPILHEIPGEVIRSLINFGEDGFHLSVDEAALETYVAELAAQYDTEATVGPFPTASGEVLDMVVTYNACHVDTAALAESIATCMTFGLSGERQVAYLSGGVKGVPFNGTYVEVDLTKQHLWFYKDGELLVDSDLVSGNVAAYHHTPTGVFQIYSRVYGTDLVGEDYRSYVNFWMPFIGGYGLHDASWRSEFGGNIYLRNGSHGCVNLPYQTARTIINNSRSGETRVIIYGGQGSQPAKEQSFKGKTEYILPVDTEPFKLDIRSRYAWPDYYYESDNPDVATVDAEGLVTIHGLGVANITVTCTTEGYFASATATIPVHVVNLCEDGKHEMGEPEVTTAPTCVSGVETTRCTKCDYFVNKSIRAVDEHTPGQWTVAYEATCEARGKKIIPCTVCGEELESERIDQLPHTLGDWVVSTAPDCENRGTKVIVCTVCGAQTDSERIDKLGHTPGEWTVTEEPTCEDRGKKEQHCTVCSKVLDTERIDATGHTPGEWSVTEEPTCEDRGEKVQLCTVCSEELDSERIDATGHTFEGATCKTCGEENPDYEEAE